MPSITSINDPEVIDSLALCSKSIKAHCQVFHGDRFTRPFSASHDRLFEVIDDSSAQKILIVAHRGFGKSSLFNFGIPSQSIVFEKSKFIVPVSASATLAVLHAENLKNELVSNSGIKSLPWMGDITSDTFAKDQWVTSNGVMVLPRGGGQQVRGMLHESTRPDLIIADDILTLDMAYSPDLRTKLKSWFFSDLINCVDRSTNKWRIIVVGTLQHESDLLNDLRTDSSWTYLDFPLCDDTFKSRWVSFMTDEDIKTLHSEFRSQGVEAEFYREYMNICMPPSEATYTTDMFKYYDESVISLNPDLETFIVVDPAKTTAVRSDYTAIVAIGFDSNRGMVYVRDIVSGKFHLDEIHNNAIDMANRFGATIIGVEDTGLGVHVTQPFMDRLALEHNFMELVVLQSKSGKGVDSKGWEKGKHTRIEYMAAYYRMGRVLHNPLCPLTKTLETQLLAGRTAKHDDIKDAVAYFPQMLAKGERSFADTTPSAVDGWSPDSEGAFGTDDAGEDEGAYASLMREDEADEAFYDHSFGGGIA